MSRSEFSTYRRSTAYLLCKRFNWEMDVARKWVKEHRKYMYTLWIHKTEIMNAATYINNMKGKDVEV